LFMGSYDIRGICKPIAFRAIGLPYLLILLDRTTPQRTRGKVSTSRNPTRLDLQLTLCYQFLHQNLHVVDRV